MLKKYDELEETISNWTKLFVQRNDPLGALNLLKIIACAKFLEKNYECSIKILDYIYSVYKQLDCKIGMALSAYGSGVMKFYLGHHGPSKAKFKEAHFQYKWLNHTIGQQHTLQYLIKVNKSLENPSESEKLMTEIREINKKRMSNKDNLKCEYKNGKIVRRQQGNDFSLLIEPTFKTFYYSANAKEKMTLFKRLSQKILKYFDELKQEDHQGIFNQKIESESTKFLKNKRLNIMKKYVAEVDQIEEDELEELGLEKGESTHLRSDEFMGGHLNNLSDSTKNSEQKIDSSVQTSLTLTQEPKKVFLFFF